VYGREPTLVDVTEYYYYCSSVSPSPSPSIVLALASSPQDTACLYHARAERRAQEGVGSGAERRRAELTRTLAASMCQPRAPSTSPPCGVRTGGVLYVGVTPQCSTAFRDASACSHRLLVENAAVSTILPTSARVARAVVYADMRCWRRIQRHSSSGDR